MTAVIYTVLTKAQRMDVQNVNTSTRNGKGEIMLLLCSFLKTFDAFM